MIILEGQKIGFHYAADRPALVGASITLPRGSMTAIVGANGCGKSTLLRVLAGVLAPQTGTVLYRGVPVQRADRPRLAKHVAYVPQHNPRVFPFTALEIALTGRSPYGSRFRFENADDQAKARQALAAAGVAHLETRPVTELSGGERQMVSVARALAQEPECILLDEPSSSLDLKHRAQLIRTLQALRSRTGLTVLMVTHDLTLLDPGFDTVLAMRCGKVEHTGSAEEVLREEVLARIFDDPHVRARRVDGRLCVWSEIAG